MANVLEAMLRPDGHGGQIIQFRNGSKMPAVLCYKENGQRARVEDYDLSPQQSVWIGFYDNPNLDDRAGFGVMLNLGKSGEKYGVLTCFPELNENKGWWDYVVKDANEAKGAIHATTKNAFFRQNVPILKIGDKPSIVGPFLPQQANGFLDVCQAYGTILRHKHNKENVGVVSHIGQASAVHDLGVAVLRFNAMSGKPVALPRGVELPKRGETSPVRQPQ